MLVSLTNTLYGNPFQCVKVYFSTLVQPYCIPYVYCSKLSWTKHQLLELSVVTLLLFFAKLIYVCTCKCLTNIMQLFIEYICQKTFWHVLLLKSEPRFCQRIQIKIYIMAIVLVARTIMFTWTAVRQHHGVPFCSATAHANSSCRRDLNVYMFQTCGIMGWLCKTNKWVCISFGIATNCDRIRSDVFCGNENIAVCLFSQTIEK